MRVWSQVSNRCPLGYRMFLCVIAFRCELVNMPVQNSCRPLSYLLTHKMQVYVKNISLMSSISSPELKAHKVSL